MIKAILLAAFVPFLTQHRNITPSNEVSTCFYGSVTGIVDNAYIAAHGGGGGGGGADTNAVNDLIRLYDTTNLTDRINSKLENNSNSIYWSGGILNLLNSFAVSGNIDLTSSDYHIKVANWDTIINYGNETLKDYVKESISRCLNTNDVRNIVTNNVYYAIRSEWTVLYNGKQTNEWGVAYVYGGDGYYWRPTKDGVAYENAIPYQDDSNMMTNLVWGSSEQWDRYPDVLSATRNITMKKVNTLGLAYTNDIPNLTGRVYDFANGSNFTKRVYIALTNVIQTLGGTVANPPAFN